MNTLSLKKMIISELNRHAFSDTIDQPIVGVLAYFQVINIADKNPAIISGLSDSISSYIQTYTNIVEDLKSNYISYILMKNKLYEWGKSLFQELTFEEMTVILDLYKNKTKIKRFSVSSFSPYMYSVSDGTFFEMRFLEKIHYNVMVPICKYYMKKENIQQYDLKIFDGNFFNTTPGKGILFNIENISLQDIYGDIHSNRMSIREYISDIKMIDDYILLTTK